MTGKKVWCNSKLLPIGLSLLLWATPVDMSRHPLHNGTGGNVPMEANVPSKLRAVPLEETSGRGITKPGTPVTPSGIFASARATRKTWFGLADINGSVYPAISTDGGHKWRADGPVFFTPGASGPSTTTAVGTGGAEFAYAWGHYGNFIETTSDSGRHWWRTDFSYGVREVDLVEGALQAHAFGPSQGSQCSTVLYVSSDHGQNWQQHGPVAKVNCPAKGA
jgi:hypothetical protein